MKRKVEDNVARPKMRFVGFALSECTVNVNTQSAKYLRAIHRTALELAIPNHYGLELGGFWLTMEQINQLRGLAEYYPPRDALLVAEAIEAYLAAQLDGILLRMWQLAEMS